MKNRNIIHARQEVQIYEDDYKPSLNLFRFAKSILSAFIYGSSTPANSIVTRKKGNR